MDLDDLKARVDATQRRHRSLAFPYAVVKKFGEDGSGNLAVIITYYTFFSIFPLLLALSSILGFVLSGHPNWADKVEKNATSHFPLIKGPPPQHGSIVVIVLGMLLAIYSGLGVVKAAQHAWDVVYCVPKGEQPGFVSTNLRALRLLALGGLGLIATTVASSLLASAGAIGLSVGPLLSVVGIAVSLLLNVALFALVFRWLTVREVTVREVLPGAVIAAVAMAVLQSVASAFIAHKLQGSNRTYGSFGTVIVLLSWFYLQSQMLLLSAQVNVVKQDRLWPRSLNESTPDRAS
jgi:YihY family inner membrane protein